MSLLRDSRTAAIEYGFSKSSHPYHRGIYLDIVPLDGLDEPSFKRQMAKQYLLDFIFMRALGGPANYTPMHKIETVFARIFVALLGRRRIYGWREANLRRFSLETHKYCCVLYNALAFRSFMETKWLDDLIPMDFEYTQIPVPAEYDRILSTMYGDWRTPVQGAALHSYEIMDPRTPYKEILRERFGLSEKELAKFP